MRRFLVEIIEERSTYWEVEAENEEQAQNKAMSQYEDGDEHSLKGYADVTYNFELTEFHNIKLEGVKNEQRC